MDMPCYNNKEKVKKLISKIPADEVSTFLWKEETVLHRHSDWEFTATTDGTGINLVNREVYYTTPGVFMLLGPNHVHKQTSNLPISRRDICVSIEKMQEFANLLDPNLYAQLSKQTKPIQIVLSTHVFNEIHDRLNKVGCLDKAESRHAILVSIVIFLLGQYVEGTSEKFVPKDILMFIQKLQDPDVFSMRVNDIITLSSYSHSHFIKLFKKYIGKSIIEYVIDLRISYAATLLSKTDLSVTTISSNVGYDNSSFFAQRFKNKFKMSPAEYRNSFRQSD